MGGRRFRLNRKATPLSISSTSPRCAKGAPVEFAAIAVDENRAAEIIGVSVSSLQKMRVAGTGPVYAKLSSRVRYRIVDLEAYVAERIVRSTSDAAKAA